MPARPRARFPRPTAHRRWSVGHWVTIRLQIDIAELQGGAAPRARFANRVRRLRGRRRAPQFLPDGSLRQFRAIENAEPAICLSVPTAATLKAETCPLRTA